jgi:hypothetical protein
VADQNLDPSTLRADGLSAAADRAVNPRTEPFVWGIEGHRGPAGHQPSSVDTGAGLLTADEHEAIDLTGQLENLMGRIVGEGPTRTGDLNEVVQRIQAIQHMILAQAAARAYPDRYRLLGGTFNEP